MARTFSLLALFLTVVTTPWVFWIYLPPPSLALWYLAALVSEHIPLLVLAALLALVLSLVAWQSGAKSLPAVTGSVALLCLVGALLPVFEAYSTARAEGVRLSLTEYLSGLTATVEHQPRTQTYAVIDGQPLRLDVWEQGASATPRPAVVRVHGGGWTSGTRSEAAHWNTWLSAQGFVVFDIDYRLAPPERWRDAPGDVKCAVGWVKRRASTFGIDPERVVLMGSSSGGHLALLAAYTSADQLPPSCHTGDTSVSAVISFSAPTDLQWQYELDFPWWYPEALTSTESLEVFTGGTPATTLEAYRLGSPIEHVRSGLPPTLLVHGGRDQLVFSDDADRLAARLAQAGTPHQILRLPFANHLFDFIRGGFGTQITEAVVEGFLAKHLQTSRATRSR